MTFLIDIQFLNTDLKIDN